MDMVSFLLHPLILFYFMILFVQMMCWAHISCNIHRILLVWQSEGSSGESEILPGFKLVLAVRHVL